VQNIENLGKKDARRGEHHVLFELLREWEAMTIVICTSEN
jgi:hypothetical protein